MSKVLLIRKCLYFNLCQKQEIHYSSKWEEHWRKDLNGNWVCNYHYSKFVRNTLDFKKKQHEYYKNKTTKEQRKFYNNKRSKELLKKYNDRKLLFKDKIIHLKENPRKGLCLLCGITGVRTSIHHIQYHEDDPLKDTIEVCNSCHNIIHKKRLK